MVSRILILLILIGIGQNTRAEKPYAGKGILRMQGTLTPAFQTQQKLLSFYLSGDMEYYVSNKISIRADSYYLLGSQQNPELFDQKFMTFFGAMYHFPFKRVDPFIGFQPGIALSSVNYDLPEGGTATSELSLSPLMSPVAGVNLYVGKFIHFFAMLRYAYGRHMSDAPEIISLSEINGSFGLGWNFNAGRRN